MPTVEQARETKAGPKLDAMFFEVCWAERWKATDATAFWSYERAKDSGDLPMVSRSPEACEAWAMRWCAENKLSWRIDKTGRRGECRAELFGTGGGVAEICTHAYGIDWKEAFVRACITAAINLAKGT